MSVLGILDEYIENLKQALDCQEDVGQDRNGIHQVTNETNDPACARINLGHRSPSFS